MFNRTYKEWFFNKRFLSGTINYKYRWPEVPRLRTKGLRKTFNYKKEDKIF